MSLHIQFILLLRKRWKIIRHLVLYNAFRIVEGGVVDKVTFKRINLRASKSLSEVADNSLSGKQVICPESDVFLINTIDFTNCYIENFRSIVRSKKATGNVGAIAFKECTINAIGNQGIVSTVAKKWKLHQ